MLCINMKGTFSESVWEIQSGGDGVFIPGGIWYIVGIQPLYHCYQPVTGNNSGDLAVWIGGDIV